MKQDNKKRKFLIASHGTFAAGIKSSLDIIIGAMDNVYIVNAYVDDTISVEAQIQEVMDKVGNGDELIAFCDILGGSVTNQVLQYALRPNVHVVSGFNLPLLIEVLMADEDTPVQDVIASAIENAREQMAYVNKLLTAQNNEEND